MKFLNKIIYVATSLLTVFLMIRFSLHNYENMEMLYFLAAVSLIPLCLIDILYFLPVIRLFLESRHMKYKEVDITSLRSFVSTARFTKIIITTELITYAFLSEEFIIFMAIYFFYRIIEMFYWIFRIKRGLYFEAKKQKIFIEIERNLNFLKTLKNTNNQNENRFIHQANLKIKEAGIKTPSVFTSKQYAITYCWSLAFIIFWSIMSYRSGEEFFYVIPFILTLICLAQIHILLPIFMLFAQLDNMKYKDVDISMLFPKYLRMFRCELLVSIIGISLSIYNNLYLLSSVILFIYSIFFLPYLIYQLKRGIYSEAKRQGIHIKIDDVLTFLREINTQLVNNNKHNPLATENG